MNRFVIVTGLPASGKSTIGRTVAAGLALPFLDKDEFLESLFCDTGPYDLDHRRTLSRLADESFRSRALACAGAVLASWWRHPGSSVDSGTPSDWLTTLPGPAVEIHCRCDPAVAAERFFVRRRQPGHLDGQRSRAQLLVQFREQSVLGPLGLGFLIDVDTSGAVDQEALLRRVVQAFETAHHSHAL